MTPGLSPAVSETLEKIRSASNKSTANRCWAVRVEKNGGEPFEFLQALERMQSEGDPPHRPLSVEAFLNLYGVDLSVSQLGRHLIKRCSCSAKRDY